MLYHVSFKNLSNLLVSIMLLTQDMATIIFTVKFEINDIAFSIKVSFKSQFNSNMNICIIHRLCFIQQFYLLKVLVSYTQAKFQHSTAFGWRDIAF